MAALLRDAIGPVPHCLRGGDGPRRRRDSAGPTSSRPDAAGGAGGENEGPQCARAHAAAAGTNLVRRPAAAPAKPVKPRKILVWGHPWTHQPNPFAEKALEILGQKTGAFQAVVSDDPRLLLADRLPQFDALVMNNIHERDPFLPDGLAGLKAEQQEAARKLDAEVKHSILAYVRGGKGLVGIHAATAALQNWPEYGALIGGFYGGHISQEVAIQLDAPQHPVNACFGGKPWRIRDEIYLFREPYDRRQAPGPVEPESPTDG